MKPLVLSGLVFVWAYLFLIHFKLTHYIIFLQQLGVQRWKVYSIFLNFLSHLLLHHSLHFLCLKQLQKTLPLNPTLHYTQRNQRFLTEAYRRLPFSSRDSKVWKSMSRGKRKKIRQRSTWTHLPSERTTL